MHGSSALIMAGYNRKADKLSNHNYNLSGDLLINIIVYHKVVNIFYSEDGFKDDIKSPIDKYLYRLSCYSYL